VPFIAQSGWALFMDGDVLVRGNLARLFEGLDPHKAVYCVKHDHQPAERSKMDGQLQTQYTRKNWSSVMLWNVEHPANRKLTLEAVNTLPGRDLHRLCWLDDDQIGELHPCWNWLADVSDPVIDPAIVHFTNGLPDMAGYENAAYADEWRGELTLWARGNTYARAAA
jgi:lipopolysaccharide biosynthesis glycosyltransferase